MVALFSILEFWYLFWFQWLFISEEESRKVEAEAKVAEETAEREAKEKEEESRKQMEEFQRRKIQVRKKGSQEKD